MTVNSTTSAVLYEGTGSTATYGYTWLIQAPTDLVLATQVVATGEVNNPLTYLTDYTVSGTGFQTGGTITLTTGVLPVGTNLIIASDPAQIQPLLLQQGGNTDPALLMAQLDQMTRMVQALQRQVNISLQFPITEQLAGLSPTLPPAAQRAGGYVQFDMNGNATATLEPPSQVTNFAVANISALKSVLVPTDTLTYITLGYYTNGDGGSGQYWWNSTDTRTDNGGSIIALYVGGTGRFNLIGSWNIKQFGAKGDGATDDGPKINNAIAALGSTGGSLRIPGNSNYYAIATYVNVNYNITLTGDSINSSQLLQTASYGSGHGCLNITSPCTVKNLLIMGQKASYTGYGVLSLGVSNCVFENVQVYDTASPGFYIGNYSTLTNCIANGSASDGFDVVNGNVLNNCSALNNGAVGFNCVGYNNTVNSPYSYKNGTYQIITSGSGGNGNVIISPVITVANSNTTNPINISGNNCVVTNPQIVSLGGATYACEVDECSYSTFVGFGLSGILEDASSVGNSYVGCIAVTTGGTNQNPQNTNITLLSGSSLTIETGAVIKWPSGQTLGNFFGTEVAIPGSSFGSIAAYSSAEVTTTVAGVIASMIAVCSPITSLNFGLTWCARCVSGGIVIRISNHTTGAITPADTSYAMAAYVS